MQILSYMRRHRQTIFRSVPVYYLIYVSRNLDSMVYPFFIVVCL